MFIITADNIVLTTFRLKIVETLQVTELLLMKPEQTVLPERVNLMAARNHNLEFAVNQSVHVAHPFLMNQETQWRVNSSARTGLTERVSNNLFVPLDLTQHLQSMIFNKQEITEMVG